MKIFSHLKAGASVAPALTICLYYLFVTLDLLTTFLASPDLRYEDNWFIKHFNLNWSQIVLISSIIVLCTTLGLIMALYFLNTFYEFNTKPNHSSHIQILSNWKVVISIIVMCIFYNHFLYSGFVVINNYLHYIYLYSIKGPLFKLATWYINNVVMIYKNIFVYYRVTFLFVAILITIFQVRKIKNKYSKVTKEE